MNRKLCRVQSVFILCGTSLLVIPQTTGAAITLVDNAGLAVNFFTNAISLTANLTVSASANTLVVVVASRNGAGVPDFPSTLKWINNVATNILTQAVESDSTTSPHGRCSAIFYCYNPTPGSGFNIQGAANNPGSAGDLVAYTLGGVDTSTLPNTGSAGSTSGTSPTIISFTITNITAGAWAAVGGANAPSNPDTESITVTSGGVPTGSANYVTMNTPNASFDGHNTVTLQGYMASIAGGSDLFTYTMSTGGNNESLAAAVFAPPAPPIITTQPTPDAVFSGQSGQFAVVANGSAPLSYQWYSNNTQTVLSDNANRNGSTTATLTIPSVTTNDVGTYSVVITNTLGSVTSSVVALTVQTLPPTITNALESAPLRLEVVTYPFTFRLVEKSTGTVLLQETTNQFTYGSTYAVSSANNFVFTSTTLDADLTLSGTSSTGHITFAFIQPGILQTTLSSSNNPPNTIFQQFADQGEDMFGALEAPVGGTLSARGYSWTLLGGTGVSGVVNWCSARAPFYLTTRSYGIYAETPAAGTMTFAQGGYTSFSFPVSQLTYDIIYGTNYATIMAGFNGRSVGAYLPPLWAFDSIWWKDDDHSIDSHAPATDTNAEANVLDTATHLTNYTIHASAEWIDRPYGTSCSGNGNGWGNLDFDNSFPNPPQMISSLHSLGYNLMLWISDYCWCDLYDKANASGWLFYPGNQTGSSANLQNTNCYYWFQTNLNVFVNMGVTGYKIDRGEEGEVPAPVENTNNTLFQQLAYNGMEAVYPNNAFVFSRNVSDVGRQYAAIWNGDTYATFSGLQYSVISAERAGILNFPMWGSDTGGYIGTPTEELFDRWFEFSAYCPIMDVLNGSGHTPWYDYSTNFTSPTNIVAIAAAQSGTHHDLMPYTRSCMYQATQTGMPVVRPIMFGYPNDTNEAVTITNCEYLYGPGLLVAPVITSGATSRNVYLPADQWLDYNNKSNLYTGPANIIAAAPLTAIPVFVNHGAIIPRGDIWQGNNLWTPNWSPNLRIEFFPSENSGSCFPYYTGSSVQNITCTNQNHTLTIQFGNLGYPGNLQVYLESLGSVAGTVVSNGVALVAGTGYTYNAANHLLQMTFNGPMTLVASNAGSLFSPLEAWRVTNFGNPSDPAISGDGDNPSGDGIPNFLKYAFGLNPLAASTNGLPWETTVTVSGTNYLGLTFQQATNATDCTFTVLVTTNLVNQLSQWETGSSYAGANLISNTTNMTEISRVLSNAVEIITVRDNVPMAAAPQRFMTVRVTSP